MIHFLIVCAIVWLTYKTVTRGHPHDGGAATAGTMLGLLFGLVSGFSFIAGGWWSVIGYGFLLFTLAGWIRARSTLPEDLEQTLAECNAMKPELDALMAESNRILNPKRPRLP